MKSDNIRKILEDSFWIETLNTEDIYNIENDDSKSILSIMIGEDGDLWLRVMPDPDEPHSSLRFRTFAGGGRKKRVRNALMILAEAIRLDLEENS